MLLLDRYSRWSFVAVLVRSIQLSDLTARFGAMSLVRDADTE